jgi:hypothetical protein
VPGKNILGDVDQLCHTIYITLVQECLYCSLIFNNDLSSKHVTCDFECRIENDKERDDDNPW